ncbi:unnamed protein product [Lactuca saligna]|uniref:Uncharacterized protein n=1 Tax=Lactuca saligna TaxID=75948 RepID=A0AA35XZN9_LACSI|nr:unnamed protein product [Lactuca saligna]
MENKISKKRSKQIRLVLHENSTDDEEVPESPITDPMVHSSPVKDSPIQSIFDETVNMDGHLETLIVDTPSGHVEKTKPSTPKQTTVIPPEVSLTESCHEEVRTSNITAHVFDMDKNVNMGEGVLHAEAQGTTFILSSSVPASVLETIVSLPPYIALNTSQSTYFSNSPTFDTIIHQPITSLFPYQSPVEPQTCNDDEIDDGGFMGSFGEIQFNSEEQNIPNHMLMSGK